MVLVQYAFVVLLVAVLVAAVATFVVMGLAKLRRTRNLARAAHQQECRFFRDDPHDMPRRYGGFAVISSGHSPRANNVTDGRLAGRPVRAFDFRCELGHGTRRLTRHYNVVAADALPPGPAVLLWPDHDRLLAPLAARNADGHVRCWSFRGNPRLATALAKGWTGNDETAPAIEVRGSVLLVATPARRSAAGQYAVSLDDVARLAAARDNVS